MINFGSEINLIISAYIAKFSLVIWKTDVDTQKIDGLPLVTYEMMLIDFSTQNKLKTVSFFEKTFLLTNTSIEVVLKMPFLTLSNTDI